MLRQIERLDQRKGPAIKCFATAAPILPKVAVQAGAIDEVRRVTLRVKNELGALPRGEHHCAAALNLHNGRVRLRERRGPCQAVRRVAVRRYDGLAAVFEGCEAIFFSGR